MAQRLQNYRGPHNHPRRGRAGFVPIPTPTPPRTPPQPVPVSNYIQGNQFPGPQFAPGAIPYGVSYEQPSTAHNPQYWFGNNGQIPPTRSSGYYVGWKIDRGNYHFELKCRCSICTYSMRLSGGFPDNAEGPSKLHWMGGVLMFLLL